MQELALETATKTGENPPPPPENWREKKREKNAAKHTHANEYDMLEARRNSEKK